MISYRSCLSSYRSGNWKFGLRPTSFRLIFANSQAWFGLLFKLPCLFNPSQVCWNPDCCIGVCRLSSWCVFYWHVFLMASWLTGWRCWRWCHVALLYLCCPSSAFPSHPPSLGPRPQHCDSSTKSVCGSDVQLQAKRPNAVFITVMTLCVVWSVRVNVYPFWTTRRQIVCALSVFKHHCFKFSTISLRNPCLQYEYRGKNSSTVRIRKSAQWIRTAMLFFCLSVHSGIAVLYCEYATVSTNLCMYGFWVGLLRIWSWLRNRTRLLRFPTH